MKNITRFLLASFAMLLGTAVISQASLSPEPTTSSLVPGDFPPPDDPSDGFLVPGDFPPPDDTDGF